MAFHQQNTLAMALNAVAEQRNRMAAASQHWAMSPNQHGNFAMWNHNQAFLPSNNLAVPNFMVQRNAQQFGLPNTVLPGTWQTSTGFLGASTLMPGAKQLPFGLGNQQLSQQHSTSTHGAFVTPEVYTMAAIDVSTSPKGKKRALEPSTSSLEGPKKKLAQKKSKDSDEVKKKVPNPEMSLNGERRLVIHFDSFGTSGVNIQTFGKARRIIPDGLSGCHTLYSERWLFKVSHSPVIIDEEGRHVVCIIWEITNVSTGHLTKRVETTSEAIERMSNGRTISNEVFRQAMDARAEELEKLAVSEPAGPKQASLRSRAMALRPRCFNQGILVFGLQHRIVQSKMKEQIGSASPRSASE